jgi:hypothetical protein
MTRSIVMLVALMLPALNGVAARGAGPVTIAVNSGLLGTVEEAANAEAKVNWWDADLSDDAACTESFAAVELRRFLAACTGQGPEQIHFAPPDRIPAEGDCLVIGSRASNPRIASFDLASTKPVELKNPESFRLRAMRQAGRTVTIIEGHDRIGTLYGVYAYLERLGVRFFGLGEQGTVLSPRHVELPATLEVTESPGYLTRGFFAWEPRGNDEFFLWMARNRMNFWTAAEPNVHRLKKLGLKLTRGGHDIQKTFLDPDTYFAAHPEWYGLHHGKRSSRITGSVGDNYCTSNEAATHELAKNLVQSLIDGEWRYVDNVTFWMLDGGSWCECDACKAEGTFTDRLLKVVDTVLRDIRKARETGRLHRDIELSTLAYLETLAPPSRALPKDFDYEHCSVTYFPIERCYVHPLADPTCTEINRAMLTDYQGWTTGSGRVYTGAIFIGEYYNVSSVKSLPVLFPHIMAADIPWYYHNGARHFHYMHTPTRLWGTWTLNQFLLARLLWSPDANADAILDDYFTRYYPTTSVITREFYAQLERATANIKIIKQHVRAGGKPYSLLGGLRSKEIFPLDHLHEEAHSPMLNDGPDMVEISEAVNAARRAIDEALLRCDDATERARLAEDERRFTYGEAVLLLYHHLVRAVLFDRRNDAVGARYELGQIEALADRLRAITDLVRVASRHANATDGFDASAAGDAYETLRKKYGPSGSRPQ